MNIINIITEIEKKDPEVYDRLNSRRDSVRQFAGLGKKIALTALPFALGGLFKKSYGQSSTTSIADVLNFALTLEYLEAEFYTIGVSTGGLIPSADISSMTTIRDHENAHVTFLQQVITSLGSTPVTKPTFDFTGGNGSGTGPFSSVFTNYDTFIAVAQTFEDTGVRAYKGQAPNLMSDNDILTAALQIHSVEARHASYVRYLRQMRSGNAGIKPWITGSDTAGIGSGVQATYTGEELTNQAGVEIVNINGFGIDANDATEAFDEPLTQDAVLAIVDPFIV